MGRWKERRGGFEGLDEQARYLVCEEFGISGSGFRHE